jgi:NAD dependent epimerase/dehydratase family enzyme
VRVVVSGSSGLIGTALVADLRAAGHDVLRLVRRTPAAPDERGWDPAAGRVDAGTFEGVDAVVGLGGVPIGDRPWSGARKQLIRDSRNVPTEVLAGAVAEHRVPVFLSASAVGYYGNTGDRVTDETGPSGTGFLAEVCRDWEAATQKAVDAGARVVNLRTGLVLAPAGGLLGLLRPLFKAFSADGSGRAPSTCRGSHSTTRSAASATRWRTTAWSARPTSPGRRRSPTRSSPRRSRRRSTGRRPSPSPAVVIKTVLGAMGEELLLYGQRAVPTQLEKTGYPFRHLTVGDALSAAVDA